MQSESTTRVPARGSAWQGYLAASDWFVAAPILFGLDKFFHWTVDWPTYIAPWIDRLIPGTTQKLTIASEVRREYPAVRAA